MWEEILPCLCTLAGAADHADGVTAGRGRSGAPARPRRSPDVRPTRSVVQGAAMVRSRRLATVAG